MSLSLTVNGVPCPPSNCLVVLPYGTFSGSVVAAPNILDVTYSWQSITPPASGGSIQVVAKFDAQAMALTPNIAGVDLNGSAHGMAEIIGGQVVETLDLTAGANGRSGGDFLTTWLTPPPLVCTSPNTGTYPDCGVCPATAPGVYPACVPPVVPPNPPPTCADTGRLGTYPDCHNAPPEPPACQLTQSCVAPPVPHEMAAPIPTMGEWALIGLALMIGVTALWALRWKRS